MSEAQDIIVVEEVVGSDNCTKTNYYGEKQQQQRLMKRRPSLLRSPPSIQLTTYTAHAHTLNNEEVELSPPSSSSSSSSTEESAGRRKPSPFYHSNNLQQQQTPPTNIITPAVLNRTQHKMLLQRQSFLADDKNYLEHPDNMRRLTKELERVNREYRCVKQFQDPFALSMKRVMTAALMQQHSPQVDSHNSSNYLVYSSTVSSAASFTTSCNSSYLLPPAPQSAMTRLQRKASSNTVHDYLLNFKEQQERRHSFSFYNTGSSDKSTATTISSARFIGRIFGSSTAMHHSPLSSSQLKRPHQQNVA